MFGMCPEDCLAAQPILLPSIEDGIVPHKIKKNPVTGEEQKKNNIFKKLQNASNGS